MKEQKSRRSLVVVALLLLVATISVGYALLSSNLNIKGTTSVSSTWDVHFENIANAQKNNNDVTITSAAAIKELTTTPTDETDDLTVEFSVGFKKPGDKYEFDVDVVNDGSIYAKCTDITPTVPANLSDYVEITYTGLAENQVIAPNGSTTMHVVAQFKSDVETIPTSTVSGDMTIAIEFEQTNPTE